MSEGRDPSTGLRMECSTRSALLRAGGVKDDGCHRIRFLDRSGMQWTDTSYCFEILNLVQDDGGEWVH